VIILTDKYDAQVGSALPEAIRHSKASLLTAVESEIKRRGDGGERDATVAAIVPGGAAGPEKKNGAKSAAKKKAKKSSGPDYKKIRFIEKTKVQKLISVLEKQLRKVNHDLVHSSEVNPPLSSSEIESLRTSQTSLSAEIQSRRVDLMYTAQYPKDEKYISLFPPSPYTNEAVKTRQAEIRQQIADKFASNPTPAEKVSADASRLFEEKRDSRKQRKDLLRQLKAEQHGNGESEDSAESSDEPVTESKPQKAKSKPKPQVKNQVAQPRRPIRSTVHPRALHDRTNEIEAATLLIYRFGGQNSFKILFYQLLVYFWLRAFLIRIHSLQGMKTLPMTSGSERLPNEPKTTFSCLVTTTLRRSRPKSILQICDLWTSGKMATRMPPL
jgi:hypothetical protein